MENGGSSSSGPFPAPGFRFYPTEEELLSFYLRHRLAGSRPDVERFIPVVDIYSFHPSELKALAGAANVGDTEQWFFFCPRAERELHGGRPARTTPSGYWKATGSPSYVFSCADNRVIGEKRTMVFYQGRAPSGSKTRWKMNEYKAVADVPAAAAAPTATIQLRNEYSVCRVYISTGTLRSFDRRPLNSQPSSTGHEQAALVHHHHQQRQQNVPTPPPAATAAITNQTQMPAALLDMMTTTSNVISQPADHQENCHDSSSSESGSRGLVADDGAQDATAVIDWDSLITPVDDLRFSVDGFGGAF